MLTKREDLHLFYSIILVFLILSLTLPRQVHAQAPNISLADEATEPSGEDDES